VASTSVKGQDIFLQNIVVKQSNNNGLLLEGDNITLDNCLIEYTVWSTSAFFSSAPFSLTKKQPFCQDRL
jgi:hypothetical protein